MHHNYKETQSKQRDTKIPQRGKISTKWHKMATTQHNTTRLQIDTNRLQSHTPTKGCKITTKQRKDNYRGTPNDYQRRSHFAFWVFPSRFRAPVQKRHGHFYISVSRDPLSHNLSPAAGYVELQIIFFFLYINSNYDI